MKTNTIYLTSLFLTIFFAITAKAQKFEDAQTYQDYILAEQAKVVDMNIAYLSKSLHDHVARQDEEERQEIIKHLDESISKVEAMPDFKGDNSLKNTALHVFKTYKETYQIELKEAEAQTVGSQSKYEEMKAHFDLQEKAESKLTAAGKEFIKAQRKFTRTHTLDRNDEQIECLFSKVVEVNRYCRNVYLAYMEVSEHSQAFFDAMKKKQIESMEVARAKLIEVSEDALVQMQKMNDFDGHTAYIELAISMTTFLQEKAKNDFVEIIKINQNKKATFDDSNRFNKMVIGFYKEAKSMTNKFHDASSDLLEENVATEAHKALAAKASTPAVALGSPQNAVSSIKVEADTKATLAENKAGLEE